MKVLYWSGKYATARRDIKEAEKKALARITEIVYAVAVLGEKANILKARYMQGKYARKCGGHKWEGCRY